MKNRLYTMAAVAAVIVTAACSGGGEGNNASSESNAQQNETVSNAASGQATPQDHKAIMHARHEHYEEMGRAMKGIGNQLKGRNPDVAAIQRHAELIAGFGPRILSWFPEGSGPEAGKTRAKAEIWTDAATFRAAAQRFEQVAGEFNRTAQGGDLAAIRAAVPELGNSCKNCHDKFRGPDDH
jgi:cytochrome c556